LVLLLILLMSRFNILFFIFGCFHEYIKSLLVEIILRSWVFHRR
jgi:hypothetical protein